MSYVQSGIVIYYNNVISDCHVIQIQVTIKMSSSSFFFSIKPNLFLGTCLLGRFDCGRWTRHGLPRESRKHHASADRNSPRTLVSGGRECVSSPNDNTPPPSRYRRNLLEYKITISISLSPNRNGYAESVDA